MKRPWIRRIAAAVLCGALAVVVATPGAGQVALPGVGIDVPSVGLPAGPVALPGVSVRLDARRVRLRGLLREHPERLDLDPRGELIVRGEILAYGRRAEALQLTQAAGFTVLRRRVLDGLDAEIVVLEVPAGMTARRALQRLRKLDPDGTYDYNHVYVGSGADAAPSSPASRPAASAQDEGAAIRVGLIDSGVATRHPALSGVAVSTFGCEGASLPTVHGTAVASLLLAAQGSTPSVAREARLYAADVYCDAPTGGAVDGVVAALAWMVRERVPVINVSLVGPANALLGRVISSCIARGHVIVAAVGNDGPAAPPLYPAAYPEVVAVTAVDRRFKVLPEAGRGAFIDFAAPGADLSAATPPDGKAPVRGTSFAAPVVAGLLAREIVGLDRSSADAAVRALAARAVDLGARGRDPVYGHGLVGAPTAGG